MQKFYFVVNYKNNSKVEIIKLNKKWYSNIECDQFSRANSLEAIDLITTKFSSFEQLVQRMYKNGYIESIDVDIFIAHKTLKENKIVFYDLLYENEKLIKELRFIAQASLEKNINKEKDNMKKIYNKLAFEIFYNEEENFFNRFSDLYFLDDRIKKSIENAKTKKDFLDLLYQNYHLIFNYSSVRNIVAFFNKFNLAENEKIFYNYYEREKVADEIIEKMDKDYVDGQYDLFSLGLLTKK